MNFMTERRTLPTLDRRSNTSDPTVENLRAALSESAQIREEQRAEIAALRIALADALDRAAAAEHVARAAA